MITIKVFVIEFEVKIWKREKDSSKKVVKFWNGRYEVQIKGLYINEYCFFIFCVCGNRITI
jgi:hypothetical protein